MICSVLVPKTAFAAATVTTSVTYSALPPTSAAAAATTPPLVMLVMSNDHQLFSKAYTDYNDIIDASVTPAVAGTDGVLETTYTDSFDYYGYFNSKGCYSFGSGTFSPTATVAAGAFKHHCANSEWSGNFLNWVSMTKIDVIRKVLFGGYRSTDTTANTVLERAYIPKDAHAFVKTFTTASITDMLKYTPFNTTEISLCNVSHATTGDSHEAAGHATPPSIRVAKGTWARWSSSNVAQCEWDEDPGADNGMGNLPIKANDELGTYIARVDVCATGLEEDNCTSYTNSGSGVVTKKPTGLLQDYGSDDSMKFGLISGSYVENNSGGVLRKNIMSINDEVDSDNGIFTNVQGIINTINTFRIVEYNSGTKKYNDCSTHSIDVSTFLTNGSSGRQCMNWGNPIGEMYLEAVRYFSGAGSASADFNTNDSTNFINTGNGFDINLAPVAWGDPLSAANYCADCSIIVISSGLNSFDMDELGSASNIEGLGGAADVKTKTNMLNTLENITGNYFVGENGTSTNGRCTSKSLSDLSDAEGLCPEEPFAKGGFGIAGLSYHALTTDLRTEADLEPAAQTITTFGVALSRGLPTFSIPTSGNDITIMPSCQANTNGNATASTAGWNQCSLIDLQVLNAVYSSNKLVSGTLRVTYEDSHWGNDYDMDGIEDISFCVGANCTPDVNADEVKITVTSPTSDAGNALRFGYTIGGTTADGETFPLIRPGGQNFNSLPGSTSADKVVRDCSQAPMSDVTDCTTVYTAGSSSIKTLKSPLWYASKWGGFIDVDNNDLPNQTIEWDSINNVTEALGSDGIPDNYFQSDNPSVLESQLKIVFSKVLARVSSGSAAAVISDSNSTAGSLYQALYQPLLEKDGKKVSWVGQIYGVFIDEYGHLREDTDGDKKLTSADEYILIKYSLDQKRTQIWYCDPPSGSILSDPLTGCDPQDRKEISEFIPIWNANYELARFSATDARLTSQRDYTTPFLNAGSGGRHILTWQDLNGDNEIDSGEILPFTDANFTETDGSGNPTKAGLLGIADSGNAANDLAEITNVVNFVRGYEDPTNTGYRSRTIDFRPAAGDEVWRLGDIIHSSPVTVGPPRATAYGAEFVSWDGFGDRSYVAFKDKYKKRRIVVYVGGNDGLIHAFNSGFYNPKNSEYCLDEPDASGVCINDSSVSHTLGAELWAYAPRNLLPQLKFLTEPNYPHVYYMDGEPRSFDVNIWPTSDATHINGWGTILVVGMGLGGGAHAPINVDVDNTGSTEFVTGSSYVILDVTDPEVPPVVLGEFTHPDLGFTTSAPTLMVKRSPDLNGDWSAAGTGSLPNDFRLVFGSGPNKLSSALSDQNAKLFLLSLKLSDGVLDLNNPSNQLIVDTGEANSFVGSPVAKNWDNDFLFDTVYFGIAGGTEAAPNGQMMRYNLNTNDNSNWSLSTMLNSGQPFLNMPLAKQITHPLTEEKSNWVFAGTGRLFTNNDNSSTPQQTFYGFKEVMDSTYDYKPIETVFSTAPADSTYLQNVTEVKVFSDESVEVPPALAAEMPTVVNFTQLQNHVDTKSGWQLNLIEPDGSAERNLARATYDGGFIVYPTYLPNVNTCQSEGNSFIYGVYERTGTGYAGAGYEQTSASGTKTENVSHVDGGFGLLSEISLYKTIDGETKDVCTSSTGEVCEKSGRKNIPGKISTGRQSWREILLF